jgi:hypothetical protein
LDATAATAATAENRQHLLRLCRYAGQVGNLRRIGNPPESLVNRLPSAG